MKPDEILKYCLENLGIRKGTFVKLFGAVPKRPGAGGIVEMDHDFQQLARYCLIRFMPGCAGSVS